MKSENSWVRGSFDLVPNTLLLSLGLMCLPPGLPVCKGLLLFGELLAYRLVLSKPLLSFLSPRFSLLSGSLATFLILDSSPNPGAGVFNDPTNL